MAWYACVREESHLSLTQLDREFGAGATGAWSKYAAGTASPSRARVNLVGRAYPRTKRCYEAPLWTLACLDTLSVDGVRAAFRWGSPSVAACFMNAGNPPVFWRRRAGLDEEERALCAVRNGPDGMFGAMTVILACIAAAAIAQDQARCATYLHWWATWRERCEDDPVMSLVRDRFYLVSVLFYCEQLTEYLHEDVRTFLEAMQRSFS